MGIRNIVIDASVLVDIFVTTQQERHKRSQQLKSFLEKNSFKVKIPMHAWFEVHCAVKNRRRKKYKDILKIEDIDVTFIYLDDKFLDVYWNPDIPYIKAGDLPYILIAKKDGLPLVTEDTDQKRVAIESGVEAFTIQEFLEEMEG